MAKKLLIGLSLLFLFSITQANEGNDIEMIQDYGYRGTSKHGGQYFARWHDRQSGVEFICVENSRWNNDSSVSCFSTGRNWK